MAEHPRESITTLKALHLLSRTPSCVRFHATFAVRATSVLSGSEDIVHLCRLPVAPGTRLARVFLVTSPEESEHRGAPSSSSSSSTNLRIVEEWRLDRDGSASWDVLVPLSFRAPAQLERELVVVGFSEMFHHSGRVLYCAPLAATISVATKGPLPVVAVPAEHHAGSRSNTRDDAPLQIDIRYDGRVMTLRPTTGSTMDLYELVDADSHQVAFHRSLLGIGEAVVGRVFGRSMLSSSAMPWAVVVIAFFSMVTLTAIAAVAL